MFLVGVTRVSVTASSACSLSISSHSLLVELIHVPYTQTEYVGCLVKLATIVNAAHTGVLVNGVVSWSLSRKQVTQVPE